MENEPRGRVLPDFGSDAPLHELVKHPFVGGIPFDTRPTAEENKVLTEAGFAFDEKTMCAWRESRESITALSERNEPMAERPSFSSPLWAAVRQGADEFAQVLPAFRDSIQPVNEPGTLGNPEPPPVAQGIDGRTGWDDKRESYAPPQQEVAAPEQGRAIGED